LSVSSSWAHGNALSIETSVHHAVTGEEDGRLVLTPVGSGARVTCEGAVSASWMHLPIPTVAQSGLFLQRFELVRVVLLLDCENGRVANVHLFDGATRFEQFNDLWLTGSMLTKLPQNTFTLREPRMMRSGLGLSFFFVPGTLTDTASAQEPPYLSVAAAGAEYDATNPFWSSLEARLPPFFRR
jgi:hypothetical protein